MKGIKEKKRHETTRNAIIITYEDTKIVAFVICYEYGAITLDKLKEYCDSFFMNLFLSNHIDVRIIPEIGHFTRIEVDTPFGLKKLSWSYGSVFNDFLKTESNDL